MLMWIMSDRAIPRSFRFMEGFGVHTFRLVNADGPVHVREVPLEAEAGPAVGGVERGGEDQRRRPRLPPARPVGRHQRRATSPSGSSACSCSTTTFADRFDVRRARPHQDHPRGAVPVRRVGRLVLDRVVDNFFAETEQVAFCTQNIVPGIDFTNDPLLQGRNFSYLDTQLKRLGSPNFTHLPVNAPEVPVRALPAGRAHGHGQPGRPGQLRAELVAGADGGPREDPAAGFRSYPDGRWQAAQAPAARRRASPTTTARRGSSTSARPTIEQQHIVDAFVFELSKCERDGDPDPDGGRAAQRRRGPRRDRRRRASACASCPTPLPPAREPRHATCRRPRR